MPASPRKTSQCARVRGRAPRPTSLPVRPRSVRPSRHPGGPVGPPAQGDRDRAAVELDLGAVAASGGGSPGRELGQRVGGDGRAGAGEAVRDGPDPQVDPVVELEAGLAAQVLDGPRELAGVALGDELGRQLGVDDDDEAVVVGDRGARPRRRLDLDLVGRQGHARRA